MVSYRITDSSSTSDTLAWWKDTGTLPLSPRSDYSRRDFEFRLSTATVDVEQSQFTVLPGVKRLLVTLDKPLRLRNVTRGEEIDLAPSQVYAFEGEAVITSFGQCQDFNVMRRQPYQVEGCVFPQSPNQETVLRLSSEQSSQPVLGIWIRLSSSGQ